MIHCGVVGDNPFKFGSPVGDRHFTDRTEQLERICALMVNSQNLILIAPRRYGKTSLLDRAVAQVSSQGGRTGRVSLLKCASPNQVVETLLQGVIDGPLGGLGGRLADLGHWLRRLRVAPEVTVDIATGRQSITFGPRLAEADWRSTLSEVVRILGDLAAADRARPVSLVIDEFQKAFEISPLIADIFKDLIDDLSDVGFVFSGSKRHLMEQMVNDPDHGALYNVGAKIYLGKIAASDFVPFLRDQSAAAGKEMSPAAAERIYDAAAGVPTDVQLVAFWAFQVSAARVTEELVDLALDEAVREQSDEFASIYDRLAPVQQRLLQVLARGPVRAITGEAVQLMAETSHRGAQDAARALERAQLVERAGSTWTIANGLLAHWLRGRYD